jgi:hypothetical protein
MANILLVNNLPADTRPFKRALKRLNGGATTVDELSAATHEVTKVGYDLICVVPYLDDSGRDPTEVGLDVIKATRAPGSVNYHTPVLALMVEGLVDDTLVREQTSGLENIVALTVPVPHNPAVNYKEILRSYFTK